MKFDMDLGLGFAGLSGLWSCSLGIYKVGFDYWGFSVSQRLTRRPKRLARVQQQDGKARELGFYGAQ